MRTALRAPVRVGLLAIGLALAIAFPAVAGAATLPSGFQDTTVPFEGLESGQGIEEPTAFRFAREGTVSVFYWIDGQWGYALSGDIDKPALSRVANIVYRQLNP